MKLEAPDLTLCVGALECAIKQLKEGMAASSRLGLPMPDGIEDISERMALLKDRIMATGEIVRE